ncbi:Zinc/iron permease [Hysterangium stoloniferum]|nr:Zinc/iron permease [Hysterangium stoloniferum]
MSEIIMASDSTATAIRYGAAGIILLVSGVASSFPTLAKHAPRIQPPQILFFVGKHFGTGVILSTAFVHLLQEGFENLSSPYLLKKWKDMSGLIVLLSFLSIFLIEYLSTVYVERISHLGAQHDGPHNGECGDGIPPFVSYHDDPEEISAAIAEESAVVPTEPGLEERCWCSRSLYASIGHHRHESPHIHHHKFGPCLQERQQIPVFIAPQLESAGQSCTGTSPDHRSTIEHEISRRTRLIGILVLQLGIMIHSVVIGLTLSITSGANFTTLFTAIIFHQLFEGLSLGIRISTLPSDSLKDRILPIVLCVLFAFTAPLGILCGMGLLSSHPSPGQTTVSFIQNTSLTRGLMCTVSAGMLIYAAAVEMLAGDFVMNQEMRQLGWGRQALALGSLVLGTTAMAVIGL